jgi:hypothetical protein
MLIEPLVQGEPLSLTGLPNWKTGKSDVPRPDWLGALWLFLVAFRASRKPWGTSRPVSPSLLWVKDHNILVVEGVTTQNAKDKHSVKPCASGKVSNEVSKGEVAEAGAARKAGSLRDVEDALNEIRCVG